eukprot:6762932-Alexandrium_andersonii.AAC.1
MPPSHRPRGPPRSAPAGGPGGGERAPPTSRGHSAGATRPTTQSGAGRGPKTRPWPGQRSTGVFA